ncbi:plasmid recombination protein, partial [Hydrogenimonas sp.]
MEKRYFVIDFKKYDGGDAYRKIVVGHNARRRRAQRPNVDPRRTPKNIELSPLRWNRHDEMLAELNSMAKANGGRRLKRGSSEWFSIVVDASVIEGWSDDDYIRYLRDAERWLRERFAGHPVLHSAIHIDEKKPHLHISFSYFNEETGRWSQRK